MRKFLLASVATLGATGGLMGAALAQAPVAVVAAPKGAPSQGQIAYPLANPTSYVNNNNNYQAAALPGALANPTPGTIVIHINGKVQTEIQASWTSVDTRAVAGGPPGSGGVKLSPVAMNEFARLYFGADGMATNGLRYGAAIEVRHRPATVQYFSQSRLCERVGRSLSSRRNLLGQISLEWRTHTPVFAFASQGGRRSFPPSPPKRTCSKSAW